MSIHFPRFLFLTNNFSFETFTDSGCTITVDSSDDSVQITVFRLPYIIFFPLRYSLIFVSLFLTSFFNLDSLMVFLFVVPSLLVVFTRYTFLVSGRFLSPFHKHFGSQTTFLFSKDSSISNSSVEKNLFTFSLQEVVGLAVDGFNKKPVDIFFGYSLINILLADDFSICLGGPFYGRFYSADSAQRITFEHLHGALLSAFHLVPTTFPDYDKIIQVEFGDAYVSAVQDSPSSYKNIHGSYSSFLSSDLFESYFARISKKSIDFEMADFNAFAEIGIALVGMFTLFIPVALLKGLNIDFFTSILNSTIFTSTLSSIVLSLMLISWFDMARIGRHMMLPWFANDQLQYNFSSPSPSLPSHPFNFASMKNQNPPPTVPESYNNTEAKKTPEKTIFSNPRNMFEVMLAIFLIPLYITLAPVYMWKMRTAEDSSNFRDLFRSFNSASGAETIGAIVLLIVFIVLFGFMWIMCLVFTIMLIWLEVPVALVYFGLRFLY